MSAHITLAELSWTTPDGRRLFSNLDLAFTSERTGLVGRNGVGKTTLLRLITGEWTPQAGSVTVVGRLGLLPQTIDRRAYETIAEVLGVREALTLLRRAEAGEASAEELLDADWSLEARLAAALAHVGLDAEPDTPLRALAGGQRTRVGLAALVFDAPDFLLLDEPTNNLDRDGRRAVHELLAGWSGGAIVVTHDRELLESMDSIVELTTLGATRYGGGWSFYREQKTAELAAVEHDLDVAEKHLAEVRRQTQLRQERQARRDRQGRRSAAKGDAPKAMINAMRNNAQETSAENARLAERRRLEAVELAARARERIEILQPFKVELPTTGLTHSKLVLQVDRATFGYEPTRPILRDLSLEMIGPERLAVSGANGSGKTTLLGLVQGALTPWSGTIRIGVRFAMLDQQVSLLKPDASIRDEFRRLNPQADENACRATLARFMFRSDAALQTISTLSGGQRLRAGLACVLGGPHPPSFLILDEPTNHLDLESITTVEAGLRAYDGALLIVSHDEKFLDAVGVTRRLELAKDERA